MKNQTIAIIIGILLISLASAIYPGECETIEFPNKADVNFTLVENTSSFEGFNDTWTKKGYDITYCFPTDFAIGNYTLEWSNYEDELSEPTTIYRSSGGGGSSRTIYKDKNVTEYVEVEKIVEVEKEEGEEEPREKNTLLYVSIIVLASACGILMYKLSQRRKHEEERIPRED